MIKIVKEATFRKGLIQSAKNVGPTVFAQSIETGTGSGIPDLFYCNNGYSAWLELKVTQGRQNYMRVSQWSWFRALHKAHGVALLLIRRQNQAKEIDICDVFSIKELGYEGRLLDSSFKKEDVIFPPNLRHYTIDMTYGWAAFHKRMNDILRKEYEDLLKRFKEVKND